jgi:hypothetical protein
LPEKNNYKLKIKNGIVSNQAMKNYFLSHLPKRNCNKKLLSLPNFYFPIECLGILQTTTSISGTPCKYDFIPLHMEFRLKINHKPVGN